MTRYEAGPRRRNRIGQLPKRVVIVDDSRTMRLWLRHVLENDARLRVVGEAGNANEARQVIRHTQPDVVTLDIEMPGMTGLEFLDRLMRLNPLPVVMISSATAQGSDAAVQALLSGAVDCLPKPKNVVDPEVRRDIVRRVFLAACSTVPVPVLLPQRPAVPPSAGRTACDSIVLIGASTGGVVALETVLRDLNPVGPPVVAVQHMPGNFLVSFAKMLNRHLPQDVGLIRDGSHLSPGQIALAPSLHRRQTEVSRKKGGWIAHLRPATQGALHCPSVDALFKSAQAHARSVIAVMLTGLGRDGAQAMLALREGGARTLGQDAATSVVYGMPRAAFEDGAVERQMPLEQIGPTINQLTARKPRHD